MVGSDINLDGFFAVEPLTMAFVQLIPTVGKAGSLGHPRVGHWSGGWRIIRVANVSKMQGRVWLILCRLKMQEKVEDYYGVGHNRLLVLREKT